VTTATVRLHHEVANADAARGLSVKDWHDSSAHALMPVVANDSGLRLMTRFDEVHPELVIEMAAWGSDAMPPELVDRIICLQQRTRQPNWDGEGACPIPDEMWSRAFTEVCKKSQFLPAPYVGACGDGTIHIEWSRADGREFLLEMGPGILEWSFTDSEGTITYSEARTVGEVLAHLREKLA